MGPDRFTIARILAWPMFIHFLSILGLFALCFVCGFVAKMFNSSLTWLDVFRCFNINHLLSGATATGLLSLFGWLTAAGGLGDGLRVMDIWRGGTGGNGGGGDGGGSNNAGAGFAGTANTGGGGGGDGAGGPGGGGGAGGSGIVVISYPSTYPNLTSIGGGLTYTLTTSGGNKIYTFTAGTGTVTV